MVAAARKLKRPKCVRASFTASQDGFGEVAQEVNGQQVKNYAYRADGKVASFQSGSRAVNYFYDGLDRLVAQSVNENGSQFTSSFAYLGNENRILLGKSGDGTVTTYIDGQGPNERLGEVKNGVGKGYITDHSGSVLHSPAGGSWKTYGLMGEVSASVPISASMNPAMYAWQGLRYDPLTGQYDNSARQYNQNTWTFTSQDPSGLRGGLNLYGSRKNNTLRYADHNGAIPVPLLVIGGAALAGGLGQGVTTLFITGDLNQAGAAFLSGAAAGAVAGTTALLGGSTLIAAGAAVVVDTGITFLTGPSSLGDPRDFVNGLRALTQPKTCPPGE